MSELFNSDTLQWEPAKSPEQLKLECLTKCFWKGMTDLQAYCKRAREVSVMHIDRCITAYADLVTRHRPDLKQEWFAAWLDAVNGTLAMSGEDLEPLYPGLCRLRERIEIELLVLEMPH